MANMKRIAQLAGVSTATVSHVLSGKKPVREETRRRVEEAIRQTGYKLNPIAKSLRTSKTQTIGVLAEDIRGIPVPEIVTGISEYLEICGYRLLLCNLRLLAKLCNQYDGHIALCREEINRGLKGLMDAHVDGIIYVSMQDRPVDGVLMPVDKPLVYACARTEDQAGRFVTYDNKLGAAKITRCFIDKGHRRIAVIAGYRDSDLSRQRLQGFLEAMGEAGLDVPPEYIRWGDWESQSAAGQTEALLALPNRPTAIFAMNDMMAAGCYRAVGQRGLNIPGDVSVAGFDNQEIAAHLHPPLTTVSLPAHKIGYESARMLLGLIDQNQAGQNSMVLPCSLCMRDSVGAPGAE